MAQHFLVNFLRYFPTKNYDSRTSSRVAVPNHRLVELSFLDTQTSEFFIQINPPPSFDKEIHWNFVRLTISLLPTFSNIFIKIVSLQVELLQKY